MNLIEQLRVGRLAIINSEGDKNTQRVIKYANPNTTFDVENQGSRKYYYTDGNNWYPSKVLPYGIKAVDVKEFIKEMDGIEHPTVLKASRIVELENKYEAEKERADKAEAKLKELQSDKEKLEAHGIRSVKKNTTLEVKVATLNNKLKELQPYDRGVEGWAYRKGKFDNSESEYITYCSRLNRHYCYDLNMDIFICDDFTTENPHKKETVFYKPEGWGYDGILKDAKHVVLSKYRGELYEGFEFFVFLEDSYKFIPVTKIGDDLQAKFDDPNNDKYISLIK